MHKNTRYARAIFSACVLLLSSELNTTQHNKQKVGGKNANRVYVKDYQKLCD